MGISSFWTRAKVSSKSVEPGQDCLLCDLAPGVFLYNRNVMEPPAGG